MTDRELLEMAARAAGIKIHSFQIGKINGTIDGLKNFHWNPLTDDGDAFRLAVKLDIPISSEAVNGTTWICRGELQVFESHNGDPYAATRRAIVRAAAEIGKAMP